MEEIKKNKIESAAEIISGLNRFELVEFAQLISNLSVNQYADICYLGLDDEWVNMVRENAANDFGCQVGDYVRKSVEYENKCKELEIECGKIKKELETIKKDLGKEANLANEFGAELEEERKSHSKTIDQYEEKIKALKQELVKAQVWIAKHVLNS